MALTHGIKKGLKKIVEHAGGGEEGKPHSTSAGRIAAGKRKFRRGAKKIASGAIEGTKKIAKPFVKEAVGLEKLKNRLKKKDKLSTWERKQKHRKEVQKHGGNVIYADEWDKIDPGLKKGIGLKKGGVKKAFGGQLMGQPTGTRQGALGGQQRPEPTADQTLNVMQQNVRQKLGMKKGGKIKTPEHYLVHGYGRGNKPKRK